MSKACVINGCTSNKDSVAMFSFPTNEQGFREWKNVTGVKLESTNARINAEICIKHFEEKFICRYDSAQAYDSNEQRSIPKAKLWLTQDAIPSLNLSGNYMEKSEESSVKKKRGTQGLANLQKARMRKMLRRERMKSLLIRRASQKTSKKAQPSSQPETDEETREETDYFLSVKEVPLRTRLRMTPLFKRLLGGSKLCKDSPVTNVDSANYPTFSIIQKIEELKEIENPLNWTVNDTFKFIKHISSVKAIAKSLRAEQIDGEAMLNLTKSDLINHFNLDAGTSDGLMRTFTQLRSEIIQRFVNI